MVDYFLIRRAQLHVESLYSDAPNGRYFYSRGTNLNSLIALLISGAITLAVTLVPAFAALAPFSWPIGVIFGGLMCIVVNRLRPNLHARAADLTQQAEEAAQAGVR
jgi:nucleobase:cation symporter-1, NCS1 family